MMLVNPKIETILQTVIFADLEKGRKGFDLPHTKAVVYWMKNIVEKLGWRNDRAKVMIAAAYAHDWGYVGLFEGIDSNDIELVHKMKPMHMERGAQLIRKLLTDQLPDDFSNKEIDEISNLVLVHDKMEELVSEEEILLMEVDTLGMLDTDKCKPTFSKIDNDIFIEREVKGRRLPRFVHECAKDVATSLLQKRAHYYD